MCHLVDDTGAKQPNVSDHLRALREAGMVVAEPHGRFTYYRLLPDALEAAAAAADRHSPPGPGPTPTPAGSAE